MKRLSDEQLEKYSAYTQDLFEQRETWKEAAQSMAAELLASRKAIVVLREGLEYLAGNARAVIKQRHMMGDVDSSFDFVVSSLEKKSHDTISQADKILRGDDEI